MVSLIIELVQNRSFIFTTGTELQSKLQRLKNSVPQGSVQAPFLLNIYIHDRPVTIAGKFAYADDWAIVHLASNRKTLEATLSQDVITLSLYLQKWGS